MSNACGNTRPSSKLVRMPPADQAGAMLVVPAATASRGCTCCTPWRVRPAINQSGVGLIEVLMAVLVLSIGFLGIAALEAMSLSTNNSAMARSMATIASYSILDAMRADRSQAVQNAYDGTVTASACPTTTTTLAQTQLGQWCKQLGNSLGSSASTTGAIACGASGECTVTITFDDSRAGTGGANNQKVTTKGML